MINLIRGERRLDHLPTREPRARLGQADQPLVPRIVGPYLVVDPQPGDRQEVYVDVADSTTEVLRVGLLVEYEERIVVPTGQGGGCRGRPRVTIRTLQVVQSVEVRLIVEIG